MQYREFYKNLVQALDREETVCIATYLKGSRRGEKVFLSGDRKLTDEMLKEELKGETKAVICGGGHISLALAKMLKMLSFHVTVLDDRPEFADKSRFASADEVYCLDFEKDLPAMLFAADTYYIIMTRGHEHDYGCLKQILQRPYGYVGMIGSRNKVAHTMKRLREEGISQEQLKRVHAPIGLPIGGQTPEEIGVSIAAELIQVRNQQQKEMFPREVAEGIFCEKGPCVMATVIEAAGSAPRGKGSRMLVTADGRILGTIGGGALEHQVMQEVMSHMDQPLFAIREYGLSEADASKLGMVCGGRVKVLLENLEAIEE